MKEICYLMNGCAGFFRCKKMNRATSKDWLCRKTSLMDRVKNGLLYSLHDEYPGLHLFPAQHAQLQASSCRKGKALENRRSGPLCAKWRQQPDEPLSGHPKCGSP